METFPPTTAGMTLPSRPKTAAKRYIAGIATWTSGEKTKRVSGNYGCTSIIKTSRMPCRKANLLARHIRGQFSNLVVQALIKPFRHLKQRAITNQPHDVSRSVQYRGAVCASAEVLLHSFAEIDRAILVRIIGDPAPHFNAANFNCRHHVLLSSPRSNLSIGLPFNPAAVDSRG